MNNIEIPVLFENIDVYGFDQVLRAVNDAMGREKESDSGWIDDELDMPLGDYYDIDFDHMIKKVIGKKDRKYLRTLNSLGPAWSNYRRGIIVYCDITAGENWWHWFKECGLGIILNPGQRDISQTRTVLLNYEILSTVRSLKEFEPLFDSIPYADLIIDTPFEKMVCSNFSDPDDNYFCGGD